MVAYRTESEPFSGSDAFIRIERTRTFDRTGAEYVRHVVRHPGGSVVVAIVDGQALCVEQYRPAVQEVLLELPAGRPEDGESPSDTAKRELLEETGYEAAHLQSLVSFYNVPCFSDSTTHVFLASGVERKPARPVADALPTRTRLINLAHVEKLVEKGELIDGKSIVGLLIARQYLNESSGGIPHQRRRTARGWRRLPWTALGSIRRHAGRS
jgi:ADP-ribose pyrophosphatase